MKVLFVGEGEHEVGSPPHDEQRGGAGKARKRQPVAVYAANDVYPVGGVLPVLARKVAPGIEPEGLAVRLREITRLSPIKKSGLDAKAKGAVLLARKHGCEGLVIVADQDGKLDEKRLDQLQSCASFAEGQGVRVAVGLAVESIEAWSLGDPRAIANVLGVDEGAVRRLYPRKHIEELLENSGKEEHRPKPLMQRLAQLGGRSDGTDLRVEIAGQTDVEVLEAACPLGFALFANSIRSAFTATGEIVSPQTRSQEDP